MRIPLVLAATALMLLAGCAGSEDSPRQGTGANGGGDGAPGSDPPATSAPGPAGTGTTAPPSPGAGTTSATSGAPPPSPGGGNATGDAKEFSESFTLTMTEVNGAGRANAGSNCITVRPADPAGFTILSGNYTATWTAQSPAAAQLELTVVDFFGSARTPSGPQASPLVMDLAGTAPLESEDGNFYALALQLASPGAMAQQGASVQLAFAYLAAEEPEVALAGCAVG